MRTRRFLTKLAILAVVALCGSALAFPAGAESPPPPGSARECYRECRALSGQCLRACNAAFADCMLGARLEMRACRSDCVDQFEEGTPELESCLLTCREEILAPALAECRPLRRECGPQCLPGSCLRICHPDGDGLDELDECRAGCAVELRRCAREGKRALRECLAPCFEIADEAEREACTLSCADAARERAAECREGFESCSVGCETTTTTTLPGS